MQAGAGSVGAGRQKLGAQQLVGVRNRLASKWGTMRERKLA